MRILVTGAGGYIGRHLVPRLRDEGHDIWGAFRSMWEPRNTPNTHWYGDLTEPGALNVHGVPIPDTVIHLAGRVEISLQPNPQGAHLPPVPGPCDIGALYRDNVLATANVLQYCLQAGVKHLIFASTQAVYGMPERGDELPFGEQPLECYAASKLAAEELLLVGSAQKLNVSILRLPGVFGGDRKEGTVYNMCQDALTKGEIRVTHAYPLPVNAMHIEDVVDALVRSNSPKLADADPQQGHWVGNIVDIGGLPEPCSLDILAEEIASLVPGCKVQHGEHEHPVMYVTGFTAHVCLGWTPKPRKERLAQVLEEIRRGS